ncbi:MAG: glycosyltransferase [Planctomycetota bacterium]
MLEYVKCNLCGVDNTIPLFKADGFDIVRCRFCGLVYVNPRFKEDERENIYSERYFRGAVPDMRSVDYFSMLGMIRNAAISRMKEIAQYKASGKILDIGCALGSLLEIARDYGWDSYGVELSPFAANYARYLGEAIESALNQTYQPLEIIVINDGSQDNTQDVASEYASKYGIKFVNNKHQGLANTLNPAIRTATSEYVMKLDADDKFDPTYVEKTMKVLMEHPEISFVYTHLKLFGNIDRIAQNSEYDISLLKKHLISISGSSLIRKSHFMQTEGFDPTLPFREDWDLWLSFAEKGFYGKLLPEPLLLWRMHGESRNTAAIQILQRTRRRIIKKHIKLYKPTELSSERFKYIITAFYSFGTEIGLRYLWRKSGLKSLCQRTKIGNWQAR